MAGKGKKKSEIKGPSLPSDPHPSGPPTLRGLTFSRFGPPTLRGPIFRSALPFGTGLARVGQLRLAKVGQIFLAKVGLAKVGFGQSRKMRMAKVGLAKVGLSLKPVGLKGI